ncbi:hypothetical protein P4O66_008802 [Electrophorus voltai]|uniref:WD repeat domain 60 n=1 Tax=Electrophorus voltai TaxID=2609070 RepID=A0AAD9DXA2_9TELE|nr:hypothetical protein P4O66_008802 [Electrophorus voltai]
MHALRERETHLYECDLQGQDRKSQRRERSKREEVQRTHRTGESTERTRQDSETDVRRERERQREKESTSERTNLREPEKEREEESRRKEKREKERRKERERVGEHLGWERRTERDDKETKDREEKQIQRYKKRDEKLGRYKERDREKERYRDKDREAERDRWKEKEREKQRKGREKNRERGGRKDYDWEKEREGGEREKERERERRRAERGKEEKAEKERGKEKEGSVEDKHREKEHERERRERHREREYSQEQEEWRERKRREKAGHRQLSGPVDREERERRKREKELWEAEENGGTLHNAREAERHNHHHPGGEGGADRDRTREREKHKEKRYEDSKSSHGNRDQGVESDEVGGMKNEDYEEDFEDYEEDFEEVDEDEGKEEEEDENGESEGWRELSAHRSDEIKAIQRAMEEENELVSATLTRPPTKEAEAAHRERRPARVQTHGRVIDFTAARQREVSQQAARRQQKRSVELLRLIELDFSVTESLLDLPPVSEYDMYIKSFGMSNTKQVYVQCNEDNTDQDTQTEEPDTHEKWTLHPAETNAVSGGPKVSQNAQESVAWMNGDSKRLSMFLHSAAQVIAVLLEENRTGSDSVKGLDSHIDSLSCSDRTLQLNTKLPLIHGRQVTLLHFSNVQVHILLSVHAPRCGPSEDTLDTHTLLCVWNIWEPSAPQKFLICEAEVQSCCFSPGQLSLVFAGTAVGSVLLWDLREHSGSHMCLRVNTEEWTLRYPTFSTDAVLSVAGHLSSVVSVEPVLVTMEAEFRGPLLAAQEESLGLSFQLGSLDENGLLILWVVVELPKADDSGSQTDLGTPHPSVLYPTHYCLRPGGKVKLLHSSSLQTCDGSTSRGVAEVTEVMPHLSLLLRFLPSDSNHYFIGTNMGQVKRGTRHGLRVVPKLYTPAEGMRPAEVTALDFCPNREPFFLVGCSDATVRLHSLVRAEPMCGWSVGSGSVPTHTVCWCQTRLTVFFVLDATSVLHVWDLAEREDGPISSENLHPDRVTGMAVFGDADNRSSSSGFALVRQSGRLEIHFLKQSLALFRTSDMKTLRSLAHNML